MFLKYHVHTFWFFKAELVEGRKEDIAIFSIFIYLLFWFFKIGFLLCSPGCLEKHSVDQATLKL